MYDCVQGSSPKYQGTYVDFDIGIEFCNELGLDQLASQLLELRCTENERAVGLRRDQVTSPTLDDPVDESHTALISPRSADSYHLRSPAVAAQSISKHLLMSKCSMLADDARTSKGECLEEEELSEWNADNDHSSIDTDITQFHIPPATGSSNNDDDTNDANGDKDDDEALSRQPNDNIEKKSDQHVEGRISYYAYGDFEPRNSCLMEVRLGLHTPLKTSSRYGSMTDASRSF